MKFKIIPYSQIHFVAVVALIDSCFGKDYSTTKNMDAENSYGWCAVDDTDNIVGYSLLKVEGKEGFFELTVVHQDFRGNGIGTALFEERIKLSKYLNLSVLTLYHWFKMSSKEPFCAIKYGFSLSEVKLNFWLNQSLEYGYNCMECKKIPCSCKCLVYKMNLGINS